MKPCTNALYVSLMSRCDSAAIVPNTSEDLPDPDTPVNTVSCRLGISRLMSFRLFSRAPWTRIRSWLRAAGGGGWAAMGGSCLRGRAVWEGPPAGLQRSGRRAAEGCRAPPSDRRALPSSAAELRRALRARRRAPPSAPTGRSARAGAQCVPLCLSSSLFSFSIKIKSPERSLRSRVIALCEPVDRRAGPPARQARQAARAPRADAPRALRLFRDHRKCQGALGLPLRGEASLAEVATPSDGAWCDAVVAVSACAGAVPASATCSRAQRVSGPTAAAGSPQSAVGRPDVANPWTKSRMPESGTSGSVGAPGAARGTRLSRCPRPCAPA